jgi:hypothetical protein
MHVSAPANSDSRVAVVCILYHQAPNRHTDTSRSQLKVGQSWLSTQHPPVYECPCGKDKSKWALGNKRAHCRW